MNRSYFFAFLVLVVLFFGKHSLAGELPWLDDWQSPLVEHRPLQIVHGWSAQQPNHDATIARIKNVGLGGVVINVHHPNYLRDEEQWTKFVNFFKAMRSAGLRVWIYDEDGYPSLAAGGVVLDGHPELESLALVFDENSEEPFFIRPAYEFTHAANNYHAARRYPNPLNPDATQRFLAVTHEQYRIRLGEQLFNQVEAFFTDEPSMMAVNIGQIPEDARVTVRTQDPLDSDVKMLPMVSWVADLPQHYQERYDEHLMTQLSSLFGGDSPEDRRIRRQFWSLLGDLNTESFYGQIQDWLRDADSSIPTPQNPDAPLRLASSGHGLHEETPLLHVPLDGNKLQVLARMDIPGLDMLNSDPMVPFWGGWITAGLPSSAAMLTGRRLVMTELSDHSQVSHYDHSRRGPVDLSWMRAASAWQAAWGATEFTLYYSMDCRGEEIYRQYCEFVARLNTVLRDAIPYRPVLLYYPIEVFQEEYIPTAEPFSMQTQSARARHAVGSFLRLGGDLTRTQVAFTLIDYRFLAKAELNNGVLEIGGHQFHSLILPDVELPESSMKQLDRLRENGFRVLVDQQDAMQFPDAPKLEPANDSIVFGHFKRDGYEIFILTNADRNDAYEGRLTNIAGTTGHILDPQTGDIQPFTPAIRLEPQQTLLYVVR